LRTETFVNLRIYKGQVTSNLGIPLPGGHWAISGDIPAGVTYNM